MEELEPRCSRVTCVYCLCTLCVIVWLTGSILIVLSTLHEDWQYSSRNSLLIGGISVIIFSIIFALLTLWFCIYILLASSKHESFQVAKQRGFRTYVKQGKDLVDKESRGPEIEEQETGSMNRHTYVNVDINKKESGISTGEGFLEHTRMPVCIHHEPEAKPSCSRIVPSFRKHSSLPALCVLTKWIPLMSVETDYTFLSSDKLVGKWKNVKCAFQELDLKRVHSLPEASTGMECTKAEGVDTSIVTPLIDTPTFDYTLCDPLEPIKLNNHLLNSHMLKPPAYSAPNAQPIVNNVEYMEMKPLSPESSNTVSIHHNLPPFPRMNSKITHSYSMRRIDTWPICDYSFLGKSKSHPNQNSRSQNSFQKMEMTNLCGQKYCDCVMGLGIRPFQPFRFPWQDK